LPLELTGVEERVTSRGRLDDGNTLLVSHLVLSDEVLDLLREDAFLYPVGLHWVRCSPVLCHNTIAVNITRHQTKATVSHKRFRRGRAVPTKNLGGGSSVVFATLGSALTITFLPTEVHD
jgi:hypothetical protein